MEEVQPPVIDPVKMRLFIDEYGSEYNLHKYEFFEFCLTGDETKDELVAILSNRILFSFMLESSGGVREKMVGWIDSIKTWEEGELLDGTKAAYSAFKNLVIKAIKAGGYDDVYILDKVRYRTIQKLFSSYGSSKIWYKEDMVLLKRILLLNSHRFHLIQIILMKIMKFLQY